MTKDVLEKWQHVLECLARDPMELDAKIDWVMKKALIESFMERKALDWDALAGPDARSAVPRPAAGQGPLLSCSSGRGGSSES